MPHVVRASSGSPAESSQLLHLAASTGLFTADEVTSLLAPIFEASPCAARVVWDDAAAVPLGWAYGCADEQSSGGLWELLWIGVAAAARGRGVGAALLADAEALARASGARTFLVCTSSLPATAAARAFYAKAGLLAVGAIPDFYGPGDDKVQYALRLSSPLAALPPLERGAARAMWAYATGHAAPHVAGARYDLLLVCCSNDERVALRAAELWAAGAAPRVLFSGGEGVLTAGRWGGASEAEAFAAVAAAAGLPPAATLTEPRSRNTGENARFSAALLAALGGPPPRAVLLLTKPFMERRALATFLAQWPAQPAPAPRFAVTSPQLALDDYPDPARGLPLEHVLAVGAGDLQRCIVYPALGFQAPQEVTPDARRALRRLLRGGHTGHALRREGAPEGSREPADYLGCEEAGEEGGSGQ